jgi:hypothetical protein
VGELDDMGIDDYSADKSMTVSIFPEQLGVDYLPKIVYTVYLESLSCPVVYAVQSDGRLNFGAWTDVFN